MGKDALSGSKNKESTNLGSKKSSQVNATPIIIVLAMLAVIVTVMILFKDKLFKKNKNLNDLVEEQKQEPQKPEEPPKQET